MTLFKTKNFPKTVFPFLLLAVVTLFFRFYHLISLSAWPRFDESLHSSLAIRLTAQWDWTLRQLGVLTLPLNIWGMALFYRLFGPSLASFWAYPALQSTLVVGAGYLAAGQFFKPKSAWTGAFLMACSFWPVYLAKFALPLNTLLLAEFIALHALGLFLNNTNTSRSTYLAAWLGLTTTLGFYTYPAFPVVALLIWATLISHSFKTKKSPIGPLVAFHSVLTFGCSPLVFDILHRGIGPYYHGLSAVGNTVGMEQLKVVATYLSSVFLCPLQAEGDYQPIGGAFLSPVLSFFFIWGLCKILSRNGLPFHRWLLVALPITLLPALLTVSLEYFRLTAALPVVMAIVLLGLEGFLDTRLPRRNLIVFGLLGLSMVWDAYRIFVLYPDLWAAPGPRWAGNIKSLRSWRAFQALEELREKVGPGAYLGNLDDQVLDQSLTTATFPFNTVENPRFDFSDSRWVALIVNLHYKPFLLARFPQAKTIPLQPEGDGRYGGDMLVAVPVTLDNAKDLEQWFELDRKLQTSTNMVTDRYRSGPRTEILDELTSQKSLSQGDALLVSCLGEKIYTQLNYQIAWEGFPLGDEIKRLIDVLQDTLQRGYPVAHLWNELGNLLWREGRVKEARAAFQEALRQPLNLTKAREHLERLDRGLPPG